MGDAVLGGAPPDEVEVDQMRGDQEAVAGMADLLERLAAVFRVPSVPPAGPDSSDEAACARSRALERITLLGAETKCLVDDFEATLGIDPRHGVRHVDERLHLQVHEAVGGRPRRERLVRFYRTCVERHHVHRRQLLENSRLARGAFRVR